jgi:hypothetical protein
MGKILFPDYFPFCLKDNYSGIPEEIRLKYFSGKAKTFSALMAAYWRVQNWRVEYSGLDANGDAVTGTGIYGFNVAKEEELVCSSDFIEKAFSFSGAIVSFEQHTFSIFDNNFFENLEYGANVLNEFAWNLFYFPLDDRTGGAETYSYYADPPDDPDNPYILRVPIANAGIANFPYAYHPDIEGRPATITITPQSYWSYGGTYNISTGFPL